MKQKLLTAVLAFVAVAPQLGCLNRDLKPLTPCVLTGFVREIQQTQTEKVDLLFMIDNSNSMADEQTNLARNFPRMIQALASGSLTRDSCMTGMPETLTFPPVRDLNVGVISSDMGSQNYNVPTCPTAFGDDGVLRNQSNPALSFPAGERACLREYGTDRTPPRNYLNFVAGGALSANDFARDFECIARMGTGGCGFEQQLEATLKALTPVTSDIQFARGTTGNMGPGGRNGDFLRPDSVLAVIIVTDEEDCSVSDPQIFLQSGGPYAAPLNLKCHRFPAAQHPVQRYIDGFRALRANQNLFVIAGIVGVPIADSSGRPSLEDNECRRLSADEILNDERMQEVEDLSNPTNPILRKSCAGNPADPSSGAFPPRRIVQVIKAFGENGIIRSICSNDFAPALSDIISKIANALNQVCLPRALNPNSMGRVDCRVVEALPSRLTESNPSNTNCAAQASRGRNPVPIRTETTTLPDGQMEVREVCEVIQLPVTRTGAGTGTVPAGSGWFYDDFTTETRTTLCRNTPQRIAFTADATPVAGASVRLECLQNIQPGQSSAVMPGMSRPTEGSLGAFCTPGDPAEDAFCRRSTDFRLPGQSQSQLICESTTRTCQVPCSTSADCAAVNLQGFVCNSELGPMAPAQPFCENPTCGAARAN